jgi:hypothetical protein
MHQVQTDPLSPTSASRLLSYPLGMLRSECWTGSGGVSPVGVFAGAPGGRPRFVVGGWRAEGGVGSLSGGGKDGGGSAVGCEFCSLGRETGGEPSRSCRGDGSSPTWGLVPEVPLVGSLRGWGSGRWAWSGHRTGETPRCSLVGIDRWYEPVVEADRAQRESDGVVVGGGVSRSRRPSVSGVRAPRMHGLKGEWGNVPAMRTSRP